MDKIYAAFILLVCCVSVSAAPNTLTNTQVDRIYQYFASSGEANKPNLGAYLWIPPNTPKIRAVMVAMHNLSLIHI